jgi:hypothetical protein
MIEDALVVLEQSPPAGCGNALWMSLVRRKCGGLDGATPTSLQSPQKRHQVIKSKPTSAQKCLDRKYSFYAHTVVSGISSVHKGAMLVTHFASIANSICLRYH